MSKIGAPYFLKYYLIRFHLLNKKTRGEIMKKLILVVLILVSMFTSQLNATADPYPDWDWVIDHWVWIGSGDPTDPPPPPSRN